VSPKIRRGPLKNLEKLKSRFLYAGIFLLVLAIYSYPAIRTTLTTGSRALPPLSAPDLTLYLNISNIHDTASGQIVDPYYGVPIARVRFGYLKFRLSFLLFAALKHLLHDDLWLTIFVWNLSWWALLTAISLWFFRQFLVNQSSLGVSAGVAILLLFNFGILQNQAAAWLHLPSLGSFQKVELPYLRAFFPQLPAPFLLLYLGFQIKALQTKRWSLWVALAVTQALAFAIFPFATMMMAGITAISLLGMIICKRWPVPWRTISIYAIACAISDLGFLLHGDQAARSGAPGQYSLVQLHLSALPHTIGGMWLVLLVLTVGAFLVRDIPPEVRWPLLGLGITNLLLLMGDAVFSETALQVSHHAGYFVHLSAAVLVVFLLSSGLRSIPKWKHVFWSSAILFFALNGMLIAHATYELFLPANEDLAALTAMLESDPPRPDDLVIARSLVVDDACGWVPILSLSHVLYCRSAQVLLSPEQNSQIQRFRQALYLYFTNRDALWVERILSDPNALPELNRLTFLGQVTASVADRREAIRQVRSELIPLLNKIENHDPEVQGFFSGYHHVFVIDRLSNPLFQNPRISTFLKIETQQTYGQLRVLQCIPAQR